FSLFFLGACACCPLSLGPVSTVIRLECLGSLLVRRVDLVPHDYIYARVRVLPVLAIDLPIQATCRAIWSCRRRLDDRDAALDARQNNHRKTKMARKPATRVEFTLFVVYEDGSRVPIAECRAMSSGASMAMPLRVPLSKNRIGSSRRSQGLRPLA